MVGYDNYNLAHQLVLDLSLEEETGLVAYCRGKTEIIATLHGTLTWQQFVNGLQYLEFTPGDWLDAPGADTTGLNFTAGDFSLAVWARADDLSTTRYLMVRGLANADGWLFYVSDAGRLGLSTCQAGGTQSTLSYADILVATWYLLGISRSGANVITYINGQNRLDAPDTHTNPLTSARELHIGILDDETNNPWDGGMHRPRAWNRALSPLEHMQLYNKERSLFP